MIGFFEALLIALVVAGVKAIADGFIAWARFFDVAGDRLEKRRLRRLPLRAPSPR